MKQLAGFTALWCGPWTEVGQFSHGLESITHTVKTPWLSRTEKKKKKSETELTASVLKKDPKHTRD